MMMGKRTVNPPRPALGRWLAASLIVALSCGPALATLGALPAPAPLAAEQPDVLADVDIIQKLGASVDLQLPFTDEDGNEVVLGDMLGDRPVVLAMVYYECPMLCTLTLNGLVKALRPITLNVGSDFDVIAVSINPEESAELALAKKEVYIGNYTRKGSGGGFHFLTSAGDSAEKLAETVGFGYRYVPERGEYAHAPAIMVLTPEGRVSHYFYGIEYSSRDLRLALVEASQGKIGNVVDKLLLYCFRYDANIGKYSAVTMALVRAGGVATTLGLLLFIGVMRSREKRLARAQELLR